MGVIKDWWQGFAFRNPVSRSISDERASERTMPKSEKAEADVIAGIKSGETKKVLREKAKSAYIAARDHYQALIFQHLAIAIENQVHLLYVANTDLIQEEKKLRDVHDRSDDEKQKAKIKTKLRQIDTLRAKLHADYEKIERFVDSVIQAEASFGNITLNAKKLLGEASQFHDEYFSLRKIRSDYRKGKRAMKQEDKLARKNADADIEEKVAEKIEENLNDEVARLKSVVVTSNDIMQSDVKQMDRSLNRMNKLLEEDHFPEAMAEEISTAIKNNKNKVMADIKEITERYRRLLGVVKHEEPDKKPMAA